MPDRQIMNFFSVNLVRCERALLVTLEKSRFDFDSIWKIIRGRLNHESEEAIIGSIVEIEKDGFLQGFEIFKLTEAGDAFSI